MAQNKKSIFGEEEIDLLELGKRLWAARRRMMVYALVGALTGVLVAFSIPREYTTVVKLAPETPDNASRVNGMADLASLAGINMGMPGSVDGITLALYPEVLKSTPFLMEFADVTVTTDRKGETYPFFEYIVRKEKRPWWTYVARAPRGALNWVRSWGKSPEAGRDTTDLFRLSPDQVQFLSSLGERISIDMDKKTGIITMVSRMQDPLVSAVIADSLVVKLQRYIGSYKTNKARRDLEFNQKLLEESKQAYYEAERRLAAAMDRNRNIIAETLRIRIEQLQNERDIAFNVYNQMAQQVEASKIKVQENTPIATVIQPASVPLAPTSPRKVMIVGVFCFLGIFVAAGTVVLGEWSGRRRKA